MKLSSLFTTLALLACTSLTMIGCADIGATGEDPYGATDKILGGRNAKAPDWMVSILRNGRIHCGGTLIHKRWVLTAAHCVDTYHKSEYTVCVGKSRISGCTAQDMSGVRRIIRHRSFDRSVPENGHDIAVLKLKKEFNNRNLSPLALEGDEPSGSPKVRARGWGVSGYEEGFDYPDRLQMVDLRYLNNERCSQLRPGLNDNLICIKPVGRSGRASRRGTCNGDSGGPIHFNGIQLGVTSYGSANAAGQCTPDLPDVYTRVSSFSNWIQNKTNGDVVIN